MRFPFQRKSIDKILDAIERANDSELNQILNAVSYRYKILFPDWEVLFLSMPRDPAQKQGQLEQMLLQLKNGDLK